jgi:hypothetical protein
MRELAREQKREGREDEGERAGAKPLLLLQRPVLNPTEVRQTPTVFLAISLPFIVLPVLVKFLPA